MGDITVAKDCEIKRGILLLLAVKLGDSVPEPMRERRDSTSSKLGRLPIEETSYQG